jgi:outer membrane biosynthesis protein TonB
MNLQAYAAHRKAMGLRGTSHVAVLKAIDSGRLHEPAVRKEGKNWVIDPVLADGQWADNTDPMRTEAPPPPQPPAKPTPKPKAAAEPAPAARPQEKPAQAPATTATPPATDPGGPSLAQAKRAIAVYQAELARLSVMREKGELVLAEEVKGEAARLARQVRDLLLIIPSRNAARVAAMGDPEEVRSLLQGEIEGALRGLAGG